ncbi:MAG TPA: WYL domain-containing protein [Anaerolineales bacterium]
MRADRLLSLLMLLQARGRMPARELAEELEVSARTIYRDIDALSAAGVPVYGEAGREGGFALLDDYRTSLTGLTEGEVRALFMLSIPAPLADLGVSQELKQAWLKLSAALPAYRRADQARVRQRFHLDATWWDQDTGAVPHLQTIYRAVWQDHRLSLCYHPLPGIEIGQTVDPFGLVAKAGVWYLVCAHKGRLRAHRVSDLIAVSVQTDTFKRPEGFDLADFWGTWCADREQSHVAYTVMVRVAPGLIPYLPMYFGERTRAGLAQARPPDTEGWIALELAFESLEAARDRLLGFGRAVEVLAPKALRESVVDYATQITQLYERSDTA